jgi:ketosteroid isomerase-like protein
MSDSAVTKANIQLVQDLYAAYGRGDFESVIDECTPDLAWHSGGTSDEFPPFGLRKGPAKLREFFGIVSDVLDFNEFSPREFYADKDKVFVLGHFTFTMKKSGRQAKSDWVHVFTIRNGKVAVFRELMDSHAVVQAYRG